MTQTRSVSDIAKRAIALCIAAMYADDLRQNSSLKKSRMFIAVVSDEFGAADFMSADEKAFIKNDNPDNDLMIRFVWMYECLNVLMYSLSYTDSTGMVDKFCDIDSIIEIINQTKTFDAFVSGAVLRDSSALLKEREKYAALDSKDEASIVGARLKAFDWLLEGHEWA